MTDQELENLLNNWQGTQGEIEALTAEWNAAERKATDIGKPLIARELILRKFIAEKVFTNKVEGAKNRVNLPAGWSMKLTHTLDRKVDEPGLTLNKEKFIAAGINVDGIIRWKPELKVKEYRELTDEQRKMFDSVLDIKPSTPQLELLSPGKK